MLIGILGKQGVGKTTFALEFIPAGYTVISFAGKIKEEIEVYFKQYHINYDPLGLYGTWKDKKETVVIPKKYLNAVLQLYATSCEEHDANGIVITYRQLMQLWGEFYRQDDPNYWIDKLFLSLDPSEDYIIDDVRKPRESEIIKVLGGTVIKLEREDAPKEDTSSTETSVEHAYYDIAIQQVSGFSADNLRDVAKDFISFFTDPPHDR